MISAEQIQLTANGVIDANTRCIKSDRISIAGEELSEPGGLTRHRVNQVGAIGNWKSVEIWLNRSCGVAPRQERRHTTYRDLRLSQSQPFVRKEKEGPIPTIVARLTTTFAKARQ